MSDLAEQERLDLADMDIEAWNDYATEQGWSDGLPLMMPTEDKVASFVEVCRGDNEPFPAMSPRQVLPTLQTIAANALMAGCRAEYFPLVVAAVRAVLKPEYNLHGTLATTHPCAPMLMINGPIRHDLNVNCGSNCFGQGHRANAAIGRALQLTLLNVGGAKPGDMDRSTQGSPAKYAFCFGENEEESPWAPYHVRRGFDLTDNVVTAMPCEPPHNINDHGSTSGVGILETVAGTISQDRCQRDLCNGTLHHRLRPGACCHLEAGRLEHRGGPGKSCIRTLQSTFPGCRRTIRRTTKNATSFRLMISTT